MTNLKCDICKTTENVSGTWYGSFLCDSCEIRYEAVLRGELSEASQYAESIYYAEDEYAY